MSISTKRGDDGTTALLFNRRVPKTHLRVKTYGRVDELNSALGLCRAHSTLPACRAELLEIQKNLVHLMAELATDDADQARFAEKYGDTRVGTASVERLTDLVHAIESQAGGFKGWTHPGETVADAFFDQARTTCRRAERGLVALRDSGADLRPELLQYLNRLADLLWLWGREHAG